MGRPLKQDVNGVNVLGPFAGTGANAGNAGIKVTGRFNNTTNQDYYLVKQRGAKTFVVTRDGNTYHTGVLASNIANNGDILIMGSVTGQNPPNISLQKLTRRLAVGFDGIVYKWELTQYQDSSGDLIKLTPR